LVVRDLLTGPVRLARRLDPPVGVDARLRARDPPLAEARPGLVAPVAEVDAPVGAAAVDAAVHVRRRAGARRAGGAAPAVAAGGDEHADVLAEAVADQLLAVRLRVRELVHVAVPVDP